MQDRLSLVVYWADVPCMSASGSCRLEGWQQSSTVAIRSG